MAFIERLLRELAPTLTPTFSMFSPSGADYPLRDVTGNIAKRVAAVSWLKRHFQEFQPLLAR